MPLPTLNWKKLQPVVLNMPPIGGVNLSASVSIILNAMHDMLTGSAYFDGSLRVPGSASAWSVGGRFITGSNTEAIYCFPPLSSSMSQSVIFAGRNTNGVQSSGTPTMLSDESTFEVGTINAGLSIKCPGFVSGANFFWTGSRPFSSSAASSQSFFSGFGAISYPTYMNNTTGVPNPKISIYESQEALCVTFNSNFAGANGGACIIGAFIDAQQDTTVSGSVDYEDDGRIYAMAKIRLIGAANSSFLTVTTDFLTHNTNTGTLSSTSMKFVHFPPNVATTSVSQMRRTNQEVILSATNQYASNYVNLSKTKLIKHPIFVHNTTSSVPLGVLRGIWGIRLFHEGLVIKDSNQNVLGFPISKDNYPGSFGSNTAILLST